MSNRTQVGTPSYIQPGILRPSLVRRSSSQRPRVGPRTRSFTGGGPGNSSRGPEHSRHGASHAPRREINSMMSSSNRPALIRALTATNTSLNRATPRNTQQSYHHSSGRDGHGARGEAHRSHQGFQQIVTRSPTGHRTGAHHVESSHTREYSHTSHHAHAPAVQSPVRRSQRISSALVHNNRPSSVIVPSGRTDQMHGGRELVRVGGSRAIYPHHQ